MLRRLIFIAVAGLFLTACDSAEERAEKHYKAALEHIENGDTDRATIEFRNVFKLNGGHQEARLAFAKMQRGIGKTTEAYSQYLRLIEQYPNNLEGRLALAELAIEAGDWSEVERHSTVAATIAPDDLVARAATSALAYRNALIAENGASATIAFNEAQAILTEDPEMTVAHQVIIDHLLRTQDWASAQQALDAAIVTAPDELGFYTLRLGVLEEQGDNEAIEEQLDVMRARFPENDDILLLVLNWHMTTGNVDAAEAFLREQINPEDTDTDDQVRLIRFLVQERGIEAAQAELDRILAREGEQDLVFLNMKAALLFETGDVEAAVETLEGVITSSASTAKINDAKVTLAQMLSATGDETRARTLVAEVIEIDRFHLAATKLEASWRIEDDDTDSAIALLREALGQSPRDSELMTLLASAHERNGDRDLMANMLANAVEASGNASAPSLRYADYLSREDKPLLAEGVLLNALRLDDDNPQLLGALGVVYVRLQNWSRLDNIIAQLGEIESGAAFANELISRKLSAQGQEAELIGFLETLAEQDDDIAARIAIVRAHINRGDLGAARDYVDRAIAEKPDSDALRFVRGSVLAVSSRYDEAAEVYRSLLADAPNGQQVWLALYRVRVTQGDATAADDVLDEAIAAVPDSITLQWIRATKQEEVGDIEGAIDTYEQLYALSSNNIVIANNLASLLANHRENADDLQRAWQIARRLNGTTVPAFQDTYGWIAYRLGNLDEALTYLEPAAAGLPDDSAVQYHLAMTYAAMGRDTEALGKFQTIVNMENNAAVVDLAKAEIARLGAETPAPAITE